MYIALRNDGQDGVLWLSYPYFHVYKKFCLMKTPVSFAARYIKQDVYTVYKCT
jgi:hypothetical protein